MTRTFMLQELITNLVLLYVCLLCVGFPWLGNIKDSHDKFDVRFVVLGSPWLSGT